MSEVKKWKSCLSNTTQQFCPLVYSFRCNDSTQVKYGICRSDQWCFWWMEAKPLGVYFKYLYMSVGIEILFRSITDAGYMSYTRPTDSVS